MKCFRVVSAGVLGILHNFVKGLQGICFNNNNKNVWRLRERVSGDFGRKMVIAWELFFILAKDLCDLGVHPWPPGGLVGNTFVEGK